MSERDARQRFVNNSRPVAPQVAKPEPRIEDVAVKAPESAPAEKVTEKIEYVEADIVTVKTVNVESLNVRSTPVIGNNIVDRLTKNIKVNVIKEIGEFSQIGEKRYVMSKFLV
jgi:hypothetical protein